MARPSKPKKVGRMPVCTEYVPASCKKSAYPIVLTVEEYETLRLIDYMGMTQEECAAQMEIGRATVQTLYVEARKKTARFLVEGLSLRIEGGNYDISSGSEQIGKIGIRKYAASTKGDFIMKIAVTYENGQVFQHFGHTEQFKVYTVENGAVTQAEVIDTNGSGHGALAGFLQELGVETLICGGIGGGARNALAQAGISLYPGACGDADAQVASFLAGSLNYDPNTMCNHHGADHTCGDHSEGHTCGGHGHSCGGH